MIRGRRLMIYGVPLRDWGHNLPPVVLMTVVPAVVLLLLLELVSTAGDKVATFILVVTDEEDADCIQHLVHGARLLLGRAACSILFKPLVRLLRVKVHLS